MSTETKTYTLIGEPRIESEYSDEYETVMVADLRRADGETGDVWIVAGVPDYLRGGSDAAGHQYGFQSVRVFGDSPDSWCPESFRPTDGDYSQVVADVVAAVEDAALRIHRDRMAREENTREVREFVSEHNDDDDIPEEELERIFRLAYGREPDDDDRENGLWSLICAVVEE